MNYPLPTPPEPGNMPDSATGVFLAAGNAPSLTELRAMGKRLRTKTPAASLGIWQPPADRPDPVALVRAGNFDRIPDLIPLRIGRMLASPFAFLRGSAAIMAHDLKTTPVTGLRAQICGDAHLSNFGFYASPERAIVLDINDFDETTVGAWEYDLKRLTTSLVVAGRSTGINEEHCRAAVIHCSRAYREVVSSLTHMPVLDLWYATIAMNSLFAPHFSPELREKIAKVEKKALRNSHKNVTDKTTQPVHYTGRRFVDDPPILTHLSPQTEAAVLGALPQYSDSLSPERRILSQRYAVCDVAFRVVGVGSVGRRAYVILLHGIGNDYLVLQVKEARPSVFATADELAGEIHNGQRVVQGQKWIQTVSDILLGWTTIDSRHFIVRQYRDRKGAIDPAELSGPELIEYGTVLGALLAKAHCRSLHPAVLDGYCHDYTELDTAMADFAQAYADQTERDYAALVDAVQAGELPAEKLTV